jgi:hypothetical protein
MGFQYEYEVQVTDKEVSATFTTPQGKEARVSERLPSDPLRRSTMRVLQTWLNRWTAVQQGGPGLPVLGTFVVLGQHLYETVFPGQIGDGLKRAREVAAKGGGMLRIQLSFDQSADDLAQLPWELLYVGQPPHGSFLARAHRLVLSRGVILQEGRRKPGTKEPPLVVDFLVAVPSTPAYAARRDKLLEMLKEPFEYNPSIQARVLERWDRTAARDLLASEPYPQIVHFIGVCRRPGPDSEEVAELYLDDGRGGARWVGPQALVNLFDNNESLPPEDQIRLVVLHLWEPSPLDFEATFVRLAPMLIWKGIPAVLAMQYPLAGDAAEMFVRKLYESLAERQSIEEAVQNARDELGLEFEGDRLFGSPVLFMHSEDTQLLPLRTGTPAGADAGPGSVSAAEEPPGSKLHLLLQTLRRQDQPPEVLRSVEAILAGPELPASWPQLQSWLARRARDNAYQPGVAAAFRALVQAVQEQTGGRHAG